MNQRTILFISKSETSASTRYRALTYFPYLQATGWNPVHIAADKSFVRRMQILQRAAKADVVVILRKTFSPFFIYLLRRSAGILVFDFDDAIFLRSNGQASSLRMKRFRRMMKICDQVWAGNHYLASAALAFNPRVSILPTSVNTEKYRIDARKPDDSIDLVWIGSKSTRKYLTDALPALESVAKQHPQIRLKIIANFDLATNHLKTLPVQWSEASEATELANSHVGIAPMSENPWTRGKCALKVLQYMAAGLPVVASPAGINKDVVIHDETGYLATTEQEWINYIQRLVEDPSLRKRLGETGRKRVIENYSEDNTAKALLTSINNLYPSR